LDTALAVAVGVEDRAAGVGDEVDRVSDAAPLKLVPVALLGQILLAAPATTLALSCGTVSSLITAPSRVRREDVDFLAVDVFRLHILHLELPDSFLHLFFVDIGDYHLGAGFLRSGGKEPHTTAGLRMLRARKFAGHVST
jgi:hypothetical protein